MWLIEDYEIQTVQLDFTSSSGGRPRSRSISVGDVQLVNAVDFADFSADPTQVHVCEHCGVVGCSEGGYVRLRRVGDFCIWLPDFTSMITAGWESQQYAPPTYVEDRGIPVFDCSTYSRLQSQIGKLPAFEELKQLLAPDAARIVQWDAPLNILGTLAIRPTLVKQTVLAVSDGDVERESDLLQKTLDSFMDHADCPADLTVDGEPVEFHLDGPHFPAWIPMRKHDGFIALQLDDSLAVRLTA